MTTQKTGILVTVTATDEDHYWAYLDNSNNLQFFYLRWWL